MKQATSCMKERNMGEVIVITNPIERLVIEIRSHVHDAGRAETTCAKHQLQAGLCLIELRACIERDGGDWWSLFDEKFTGYIKSRSYAEKLMRWAKSDDPEGALNAEKERVREAVQQVRDKERALRNADNNTDQSEPTLRLNKAEQKAIQDFDNGCHVTSIQDHSEDLVGKALRLVERMSMDEREQFDAAYREKYQ